MSEFEDRYRVSAEADHYVIVLRERCTWLTERIAAKRKVGWDTTWDVRERNALKWALTQLQEAL